MDRRNILNLTALAGLGLTMLPGSAVSQQKSLKEQLVGAWTMVSDDKTMPDGSKQQVYGANPKGILIFDASGRFSHAQGPANRAKFKSANRLEATAEEMKVAIASLFEFGRWSVNEADKTILLHIDGSIIPNAEGTDTKRLITSLTADELKYTNPGPATGGKNETVWRRAK